MTVTYSAVFDTITQTTFKMVICVLPYEKLLEAFEKSVKIQLKRLKENIKESDEFMGVRDTLPTKLLSGGLLAGSLSKEVAP